MHAQKILKRLLFAFAVIIIAGYSMFRLYDLVSGPKIEIYSPLNGGKVDSVFVIKGKVTGADKIYLFDREIFTDQEGLFEESMISSENYTDVQIRANNRWGKTAYSAITVENANITK